MRTGPTNTLLLLLFFFCVSFNDQHEDWHSKNYKQFNLYYTPGDKNNIKEYATFVEKGIKDAEQFFNGSFKNHFNIYIHNNRHSLDSTWQTDWKMPGFKSECWMVASGVATRLDMISPVQWNTEACEHRYEDKTAMQQLIAHELVHVYHGQQNKSPDFSDVENIDWFVEGLASYASGQCNCEKLNEIKKVVSNNEAPSSLDKFWTGKYKYGLSGSVVMFIDKKYGREKLKTLLPSNKKDDILYALKISETELLKEWRTDLASYNCK